MLVLTAHNEATKQAFALPKNQYFFKQITSQSGIPTSQLRLPLDSGRFGGSLQDGITFGSDPEQCHFLLAQTDSTGIDETHFTLLWEDSSWP